MSFSIFLGTLFIAVVLGRSIGSVIEGVFGIFSKLR
jgi:hypothetical protein